MGKIFLKKKMDNGIIVSLLFSSKSNIIMTLVYIHVSSPFTCFGYVLESIRFHVIFWYWFIKVHVKRVKRQIKHANFVNGKGSFSARITCVVNETTRFINHIHVLSDEYYINNHIIFRFLNNLSIDSTNNFALKKKSAFLLK